LDTTGTDVDDDDGAIDEGFVEDAKPDESLLPPPQDATDNAMSSDHAKLGLLDSTRVLFMSFSTPDVIPVLAVCAGHTKVQVHALVNACSAVGLALIYRANAVSVNFAGREGMGTSGGT